MLATRLALPRAAAAAIAPTTASFAREAARAGVPVPALVKPPTPAETAKQLSEWMPRYLTKIGCDQVCAPTLDAVTEMHRGHIRAIPYSTQRVFMQIRPPTDAVDADVNVADAVKSLVDEHNGGYCHEANQLMHETLKAFGLQTEYLLARMHLGKDGAPGARTHLFNRVLINGQPYLLDVGFGGWGYIDPLPEVINTPIYQEVTNEWFRIVEDPAVGRLIQRKNADGAWAPLYSYQQAPALPLDIAMGHFYAFMHSKVAFRRLLLFCAVEEDFTRVSCWGRRHTVKRADGSETITTITDPETVLHNMENYKLSLVASRESIAERLRATW